MNSFLAFLLAPLAKVSPFILRSIAPILADMDAKLFSAAYPFAVAIVRDLARGDIAGLDKHKAAVIQLKSTVTGILKFEAGRVKDLHLGLIIMTAYANELNLPGGRSSATP